MADISKIQLPSGSTYTLKDGRIPSVTSSDNGKVVMVNSSGNLVVATLPIYDGSVIDYANGENF